MSGSTDALLAEVSAMIADALDRRLPDVTPDASLVDDLGAESIDFLDLVFRIESTFRIKVPVDALWRREGDAADAASNAELARRVTPRTIAAYLASVGAQPTGKA